jgi:hypothetical protein
MPTPGRDLEPDQDVVRSRVAYAIVVGVALIAGIGFAINAPDRTPATTAVAAAAPASTPATSGPTTSTAAATTRLTPTTTTATGASTTGSTAPTTSVDAGDLPQTDAKPSASGATFDADVRALWQAVVNDDPDAGLPFFFPRGAYLQVKSISDPATDYKQRLLANFAEDVHAIHAQLGADAARAVFVGIEVPVDQAVWVQPGAEYNKLSYWRVYGTSVRYTVGDQTRTFPVTSLISWRGEWYVVHLGAIR